MGSEGENLDAFRANVRAWLEENFPPDLKDQGGSVPDLIMAGRPLSESVQLWRRRMGQKGWGTPTWPKEYGGGGLSPQQARILEEEMNRIGAFNPIVDMGVGLLGPTMLEYGTEDQKRRHLRPIARGEKRWCQGYSEPDAGSDLASLQTRCEDRGDHYLVNGSKIWTSGAQFADWCFCLVRTDPNAPRKQEGISFVLLDMRQSGVEVVPIRLISGPTHFNQVFFTDVRVEKNDVLGPLNGGWTVAKRLLQFERANTGRRTDSSGARKERSGIADLAKSYVGTDGEGRLADPDLRTRLAMTMIELRACDLTRQRAAAEARSGSSGAAVSVIRSASVKANQDRDELLIEIMGTRGLGWETGPHCTPQERRAVRNWLAAKSSSIWGGTWEIQQNIIAKRLLGLPDTTGSA